MTTPSPKSIQEAEDIIFEMGMLLSDLKSRSIKELIQRIASALHAKDEEIERLKNDVRDAKLHLKCGWEGTAKELGAELSQALAEIVRLKSALEKARKEQREFWIEKLIEYDNNFMLVDVDDHTKDCSCSACYFHEAIRNQSGKERER